MGLISEQFKNTPIKSRLRAFFWFEYIDFVCKDQDHHTKEQNVSAWKYAEEKTEYIMKLFKNEEEKPSEAKANE